MKNVEKQQWKAGPGNLPWKRHPSNGLISGAARGSSFMSGAVWGSSESYRTKLSSSAFPGHVGAQG